MAKRRKKGGRDRAGTAAAAEPGRSDARQGGAIVLSWWGWRVLIVVVTPQRVLQLLTFLLLFCRPIAAPDLWWQMSRGREVLNGSWTPSNSLLAAESAADADWLGGLPVFLSYMWFGGSGLMLCRLAGGLFLMQSIWRLSLQGLDTASTGSSSRAMVATILAAILVSPACDPTPRCLDLLLLVVTWQVTTRSAKPSQGIISWGRAGGLLLTLTVWANLGPGIVWGLLLVSCWLLGQKGLMRQAAIWIASLVACSLTPRGMWTLWDSTRLTVPQLASDNAGLVDSPWSPTLQSELSLSLLLLILLAVCGLAVLLAGRLTSVVHLCGLLCAQTLAWISADNLVMGGVWTLVILIDCLRSPATADNSTRQSLPPWYVVSALASCLLVLSWVQSWPSRLGWGIQSQLDYRLVQLALESSGSGDSTADERTAFCTSIRGAGMLAWLSPGIRPQDTPERSLLGGRWPALRALTADLRRGRKTAYRRSDGESGGWWIPLQAQNTSLLLVDATETEMIRALEPTLWKPLSLDSAVIPFASAGDPNYTLKLVEILQFRGLVDSGAWSYQPPSSTGSTFDRDRFGLWRQPISPSALLRQASVFRAMQLHVAALRVLSYGNRTFPGRLLRREFAACQQELADAEAVLTGKSSQFRQQALWQSSEHYDPGLAHSAALTVSAGLRQGAEHYVRGELERAVQQLDRTQPQEAYAAAWLLYELGDLRSSGILINSLVRSSSDKSLTLLARDLQNRLTTQLESRDIP